PTRTRRRDGEDLGGEVAAPALLETTRDAVRLDCVPELADPDPGERVGEDHRRPGGFAWPEGEHLPHVGRRRARERVLALVDRDHVRDLHDPRLQRLHGVSGARLEGQHDRVGVERFDEPIRRRVAVLDERDRAREGARVAGPDTVDQALRVVVHAAAGCGSGSTPRANSQARPEATPMPLAATTYVQRAPIAFVTGPAATNDAPSAP